VEEDRRGLACTPKTGGCGGLGTGGREGQRKTNPWHRCVPHTPSLLSKVRRNTFCPASGGGGGISGVFLQEMKERFLVMRRV